MCSFIYLNWTEYKNLNLFSFIFWSMNGECQHGERLNVKNIYPDCCKKVNRNFEGRERTSIRIIFKQKTMISILLFNHKYVFLTQIQHNASLIVALTAIVWTKKRYLPWWVSILRAFLNTLARILTRLRECNPKVRKPK